MLIQKSVPAGLREEQNIELTGINRVTLRAEWRSSGAVQSKQIEFYVYRNG